MDGAANSTPNALAAELAARADAVTKALAEAQAWVDRNPGTVRQDAPALRRDLRRRAREAQRLAGAAVRPMCVSVFGPSQAGKSYLISALARKDGAAVIARFGAAELDFVRDINPEGGQEATGLVTRFTLKPPATAAGGVQESPVALRLLSGSDVVRILGNAVMEDFVAEDVPVPTPDDIEALLSDLEARAGSSPVPGLSEDDAIDVAEYFQRDYRGQATTTVLTAAGYWSRIETLAPRLSLDDRARLFAPLWGDLAPLTDTYLLLMRGLEALGYAQEAYAGLDALQPRETSIVDVRTLRSLGVSSGVGRLTVTTAGGRRAELERPVLAALVAEMTVVLKDRPWPFFDHTDLLDFPGARSRERLSAPQRYLAERDKIPGLFLRGKVAYLFQRYCAERELTAMLLCVGPSNQEVRTLPRMVRDWIDVTLGDTPEKRAGLPNALFLILTKFDQEFEEKQGQADSSSGRWTTRLQASLLDFFGKADVWPTEWTPGQPFRNTLWLRNPNYKSKHLLDYGADDLEIGLRPTEVERVARLRAEFVANAFVRAHFIDPARAWDEAMRLNDGGISYLAERLAPVCNEAIKRAQVESQLKGLTADAVRRLEGYFVSGDLAAELAKREAAAKAAVAKLATGTVVKQRFGHFLRALMLPTEEAAQLYRRTRTEIDPDGGGDPVGQTVDADALLADIFGDAPETETQTAPKARDQAEAFADLVLAAWIERVRSAMEDPDLLTFLALTQEPAAAVAKELNHGADRLHLRARIAARARSLTDFRQKLSEQAAKAGLVAEGVVNNYVATLGWTDVLLDERPTVGKAKTPIFRPRAPIDDMPPIGETPSAFDSETYRDWMRGFVELTTDNVRKRAQGDGDAVDVRANAELGAILAAFRAAGGTP